MLAMNYHDQLLFTSAVSSSFPWICIQAFGAWVVFYNSVNLYSKFDSARLNHAAFQEVK